MELIDLLRTLRRRWIVATLAAWVVLAIGMYSIMTQDEKYEASASMIVTPAPAVTSGAQAQSIFVVQNSLPALEARLESRTFYATALAEVPEEVRDAKVTITPASDPGTGLFNIVAESSDVDAVAPWANAFAAELVASNPYTTITLEPLDPAIEPDSAETAVKSTTLVALIALALIVGTLAALAANALARRDPSAELRRRYGVDVIGEIPHGRRLRSSGAFTPARLFGSDANPRMMEAFQSLRAEVEILIHGRGLETLAITSALPGEGKSTVSSNLAWALASVGHKVTLIDCDLRNPTLHATFGYSRFSAGVSDVLDTDERSLADLARGVIELPGLSLVPAGVPARHPAEILGPSLGKLIPEFTGPDRLVLIDSPPLEGVAESRTIVAAANAVVLVIDARQRRESEEIERALQIIGSSGAHVVGIVLNRARVRRTKETARYIVAKPRIEAGRKKPASPSNAPAQPG